MLITTAIEKMIDFYEGNIHDIDHFLKVWALGMYYPGCKSVNCPIQSG